MSRRAARAIGNLARRSVALLLIAYWLTGGLAVADTVTTACAGSDNTATTYCPALQAGTDDDSAVLAGFEAGGVLAFGVGAVVGVAGLYRRFLGGR